MDQSLAKALTAELVGTFALIFVGAGTAAIGAGGLIGVALAHGMVVVGFAYAYGHLSGVHINPAVTLAVWIAGKIETDRAAAYVAVQLVGGILGGLALRWTLGGVETGLGVTTLARGLAIGTVSIDVSPASGCFIEAVLTFFLVNSVLNAAVSGKAGDLAGLAVGLTLVFCILLGAPLTGASLNPARTIGPAVVTGSFADLWVYLAGPVLGAGAAATLYRGVLARD